MPQRLVRGEVALRVGAMRQPEADLQIGKVRHGLLIKVLYATVAAEELRQVLLVALMDSGRDEIVRILRSGTQGGDRWRPSMDEMSRGMEWGGTSMAKNGTAFFCRPTRVRRHVAPCTALFGRTRA